MMASYDTGVSSRAAAYAVWAFLICGYAVYAVALKKSHVSSICCTLVLSLIHISEPTRRTPI
eukprot:2365525-Pleurochrysis_carterae.AAC.1